MASERYGRVGGCVCVCFGCIVLVSCALDLQSRFVVVYGVLRMRMRMRMCKGAWRLGEEWHSLLISWPSIYLA